MVAQIPSLLASVSSTSWECHAAMGDVAEGLVVVHHRLPDHYHCGLVEIVLGRLSTRPSIGPRAIPCQIYEASQGFLTVAWRLPSDGEEDA